MLPTCRAGLAAVRRGTRPLPSGHPHGLALDIATLRFPGELFYLCFPLFLSSGSFRNIVFEEINAFHSEGVA